MEEGLAWGAWMEENRWRGWLGLGWVREGWATKNGLLLFSLYIYQFPLVLQLII